jgi:hypothetical protein
MIGLGEIVPSDVRQSAITSQSIGVSELETVMRAVPQGSQVEAYEQAIVTDNVLGLKTSTAREWRFKTLRRLYRLDRDTVLFRAMSDLWPFDSEAHPLLAGLCAAAHDTVFRSTAAVIRETSVGDEVTLDDLVAPIESAFPGAYQPGTLETVGAKAYASWAQTGHLGEPSAGRRLRERANCRPPAVAFALLLGHLEGHRGEALFETLWAALLDRPRSHLYDLAFAASQQGMLEFRNAGGVVEVGFQELLRPIEGQLL